VLGDKAYSSRAIRTYLRKRQIKATIPEPADQKKNRLRRGCTGGRPPRFDPEVYKQRNVVERAFNKLKATGQWPPDTTVRILLPPRVGGLTRDMTDHGVLCLICRSPVRGGACCRRTDEACPDRGLAANRAPSQS
jgi:transposase